MVITTESLPAQKPLRCGQCGLLVRGDLTLVNPNGKAVGECCASPSDRRLLAVWLGDAAEPVQDEPAPITKVLDVLKLRG